MTTKTYRSETSAVYVWSGVEKVIRKDQAYSANDLPEILFNKLVENGILVAADTKKYGKKPLSYIANQSAVYVNRETGANFEVVLEAGKSYPIDPDDPLQCRMVKDLLANGLIKLVDTKPIDRAEFR